MQGADKNIAFSNDLQVTSSTLGCMAYCLGILSSTPHHTSACRELIGAWYVQARLSPDMGILPYESLLPIMGVIEMAGMVKKADVQRGRSAWPNLELGMM
jgi:hypothetical protein